MSSTSASGGLLEPLIAPAPLQDNDLVDFFQEWVSGITGIKGANVRPRWQPEPPNLPDAKVDWVAIGIKRRVSDTYANEVHYPVGDGYNETRRHQILHLLASFYGPNADKFAGIFDDGIQVAQNREILTLNGMGLVETGELIAVPEMVKDKWQYRVDLPFSIRRQIVRRYKVENLASAEFLLNGVDVIVN